MSNGCVLIRFIPTWPLGAVWNNKILTWACEWQKRWSVGNQNPNKWWSLKAGRGDSHIYMCVLCNSQHECGWRLNFCARLRIKFWWRIVRGSERGTGQLAPMIDVMCDNRNVQACHNTHYLSLTHTQHKHSTEAELHVVSFGIFRCHIPSADYNMCVMYFKIHVFRAHLHQSWWYFVTWQCI